MAATAAEKLRDKLTKLFAMLGSNNAAEREVVRCKIDKYHVKNKKNWNDLTELLSTGNAQGWQDDEYAVDTGDGVHEHPVRPAPLDLIRHILQRHLHLTGHQFVAVTLWVAHTFLYNRFAISPRLALEFACPRLRQEYAAQHHQDVGDEDHKVRPHYGSGAIPSDRPGPPDIASRRSRQSGFAKRSDAARGDRFQSRLRRQNHALPRRVHLGGLDVRSASVRYHQASCRFRSCTAASSSTWRGARRKH